MTMAMAPVAWTAMNDELVTSAPVRVPTRYPYNPYALAEERAGLRRYLEGLVGPAFRGELDDVGPVGVHPELGDQASRVVGRRELQLEDVHRTESGQCVELQTLGSVLPVDAPARATWRSSEPAPA